MVPSRRQQVAPLVGMGKGGSDHRWFRFASGRDRPEPTAPADRRVHLAANRFPPGRNAPAARSGNEFLPSHRSSAPRSKTSMRLPGRCSRQGAGHQRHRRQASVYGRRQPVRPPGRGVLHLRFHARRTPGDPGPHRLFPGREAGPLRPRNREPLDRNARRSHGHGRKTQQEASDADRDPNARHLEHVGEPKSPRAGCSSAPIALVEFPRSKHRCIARAALTPCLASKSRRSLRRRARRSTVASGRFLTARA